MSVVTRPRMKMIASSPTRMTGMLPNPAIVASGLSTWWGPCRKMLGSVLACRQDRPDEVAGDAQGEVHADAEREGVEQLQECGEERLTRKQVARVERGEQRRRHEGDRDLGVPGLAHQIDDVAAREDLFREADAQAGQEPRTT